MSAAELKLSASEQLLDCVISKNRLLCRFSVGLSWACVSVGKLAQLHRNDWPLASSPAASPVAWSCSLGQLGPFRPPVSPAVTLLSPAHQAAPQAMLYSRTGTTEVADF